MPRTAVPTPLAAAVGLVPAVLAGVCHLPRRALRLPALALTGTFALIGAARHEYDDLAVRGERLYARLRGQDLSRALDAVEDAAQDLVDRTPFAAAYAAVEEVVESVRGHVDSDDHREDQPAEGEPLVVDLREEEQPKGAPTPKAPQNQGSESNGRRAAGPVDTAASPEVVALVEAIVEELTADPSVPQEIAAGGTLAHADLPLPGYDHLTLGSLRGRLRALDVVQLVQLRDYEKAHANRLPVVTMLDNRIAKLGTLGATPVVLSGDSDANGSTRSH